MQVVSSGFTTNTAANFRKISHGLLVAWQQTINSSFSFFTIGTSHIGGADIIKGAGTAVTFFDRYQYTNETPYVMDWKITRAISQQPWGVIMASATVTLDNTSNRFLPGFDATIGAYTTLANRPVKIQGGFSGELINLFVGFTDNTSVAQIGARQFSMQLFDAMTFLQATATAQATFVNMTRDQIITSLLNEAGFSSGQISIDPSTTSPIAYYAPYGRYMTDIFQELSEAEAAQMFVDENGVICWYNRSHIGANTTANWAFSYSNTIGDPSYLSTQIINDVNITTKPLALSAYNKIFQDTTGYFIAPGQSITVIANFTGGNIAAAYTVDTPYWVGTSGAGNSTFSTNGNQSGTGLAVSGITLTSHSLTGSSYLMTFLNSSSNPAYITDISLWGVPATIQTVQTNPAIDTTSIGKYNLNPNNNFQEVNVQNDTLQNQYEANSLAQWYVSLYKNPYTRLKIDTFAVPQLQMFDWVSFFVQETATTIPLAVMAITLELQAPGDFKQTLDVEGRPIFRYFTIGVSTIGGTDGIAP
jgi:hypothetical protein